MTSTTYLLLLALYLAVCVLVIWIKDVTRRPGPDALAEYRREYDRWRATRPEPAPAEHMDERLARTRREMAEAGARIDAYNARTRSLRVTGDGHRDRLVAAKLHLREGEGGDR